MNGHMTIGDLSARTGVPVKALREYTDLGLIYTLGRSPAGYRLYTDDAEWCVRFIGELRGLGLTIAEICQLTDDAVDSGDGAVGARLAELLERSRQRLHRRISDAQQILDRIDDFTSIHRARWAADDVCWTEVRADARRGLDSAPGGRPYRHRHRTRRILGKADSHEHRLHSRRRFRHDRTSRP